MIKRPKILVVPSDPIFGTDWYRTTGVFPKLPIDIVKPDGGKFSWSTLAGVDIVYFQRPATQFEVHCLETAKKYKKPILLDYDDNPLSLNEDNPVYEFWNRDDKRACIKHCIKLANIIMVSTEALRTALLEIVPEADVRVVPNAQDDSLFSFEPSFHERRKIIAMRGGSSHKTDWFEYKDGILETLRQFPEYKLAVMGFHPEWLREVPEHQLELYEFRDLPTYYENLMQLRPEIGLVPLSDNVFNRAKSNIGWQEFTLAGATVIASDLPEFQQPGVLTVRKGEHIVAAVKYLNENPINRHKHYIRSLESVPKLSVVNELRRDIIEELSLIREKYSPKSPEFKIATNLEFHEHTLSHGHTQDDMAFREAMGMLADWLIKTVNPKTAVEIGCGTGGAMVELLKRGVQTYGFEINPYAIEHFRENHPMYANQIFELDITNNTIQSDNIGDLVYSTEVFEHITMPEEWWESFLTDLSTKFRYFYFTSTPYYENESWDYYWGHKNIRRTSTWIKLFERSGWKFESNPKALVNWDVLFSSKNVA